MGFFSKLGNAWGAMQAATGIPILKEIGTAAQTYFSQDLAEEQLRNEQNFNAAQAQLNRDFQREERLATQEFNVDMWNKNNEYNSASAQLERAREAGINPNALFSNGYNSATSSPVTSSPMSGSAASSSASIASGLLTHSAQISNLMAQARKTESEADINQYNLGWNKLTEAERYKTLENTNNETLQRMGIAHVDSKIRQGTFMWLAQQNEADLKLKSEQLNLLRNQNLHVIEQVLNTRADTLQKGAHTEYIQSQTAGQDISNEIQKLQLDFSTITGIPVGANEFQVLYNLWQQGKWNDFTAATQISASTKGGAIGAAAVTSNLLDGKINNLADEGVKFGKALQQGGQEIFNKGKLLYKNSLPYANSLVERLMQLNPF